MSIVCCLFLLLAAPAQAAPSKDAEAAFSRAVKNFPLTKLKEDKAAQAYGKAALQRHPEALITVTFILVTNGQHDELYPYLALLDTREGQ